MCQMKWTVMNKFQPNVSAEQKLENTGGDHKF